MPAGCSRAWGWAASSGGKLSICQVVTDAVIIHLEAWDGSDLRLCDQEAREGQGSVHHHHREHHQWSW